MPMSVRRMFSSPDTLVAALLALFFALILFALKNPTSLDDGLRHFAMARVLRDQGVMAVPGWSNFFYEGWLHRYPVDPWFLSDVLLIPFTFLPLAKGLQLFVVFEIVCLLSAFLLVLRSFRVPPVASSVFLLLLVFGETQFMGRFLFGRPYALLTAMTLFVIYAMKERHWMFVSVAIAISVLLSQLFVFPLFLCACGVAAFLVTKELRDACRLMIASVCGVFAGLILHPEPLLYAQYLLTVFLKIPFLKSIGLSREMQAGLTNSSALSVLAVAAVILLFGMQLHRHSQVKMTKNADILTLCIAILFFGGAFLIWLRAIDILWPLLLICAAALYAADPSALHKLIVLFRLRKKSAMLMLTACFTVVCTTQVLILPYIFARDDASHSLQPYESLAVIPPGSRVLNLDWEKFFQYVSVRPDLQYAMGIDPSFTHLTDPEVLPLIGKLTNQSPQNSVDPTILIHALLEQYPSECMILSQARFSSAIDALEKAPSFEKILETDVLAVFKVL